MNVKFRRIEVADETADLLEARAAARGVSVADLVAELAGADDALPADLLELREAGRGPWAPEIMAEDQRRLDEFHRTGEAVPWEEMRDWMKSWGTADELPRPKPRKL